MIVRRFERLDFAKDDLAKPVVSAEGFWKLDGRVARTGIQIYHDAAGNQRRELRLPTDVKASLASFALAPLTNGHPPQLVTPDNAKQYATGAVGEATYADGWVKAPLTVWTKDAIDAIRAGRAQLSVGYRCELVDESGEYEGEKYDCKQTNIVVNHLALVDTARAGPEARLRLDAGDAVTVFGRDDHAVVASSTSSSSPTESAHMPIKFKVDGFEIEVADVNAQSIVERAISGARKDADDKLAVEKSRADQASKDLDAAKAKTTELQAKCDTLEAAAKVDVKCDECDGSGKVGEKACMDCDGKGQMKEDSLLDFDRRKASRARSDAAAASKAGSIRAKLLLQAAEHLSANEKLDGKTDVDIKKLILSKVDKDLKLDGRDDVYVSHRFDFEMEQYSKKKGRPIDRVRLVTDPTPKKDEEEIEEHVDSPEDARAVMQKRNALAFVKRR